MKKENHRSWESFSWLEVPWSMHLLFLFPSFLVIFLTFYPLLLPYLFITTLVLFPR